ncbi:MAG: hypothetical protein ABR89_02310 [Rhodobacter sp. BACL10 MAG-120910-bin24]|nr:MAG: hypothetical protein ABR89_02310 [Rhodobacter sp. BACL10 MAG-120910-bin24]
MQELKIKILEVGASCVDQTILAKEKAVLAFFNQCLGLYPHVMQARGHSCACQASFIILSGSRKFRLAWSVFLGMVVRRSVLARAIGLVNRNDAGGALHFGAGSHLYDL